MFISCPQAPALSPGTVPGFVRNHSVHNDEGLVPNVLSVGEEKKRVWEEVELELWLKEGGGFL